MTGSHWQATVAHVRACAGGIVLAVGGLLLRRPDLLVLAAPLLAIGGWSAWLRPKRGPIVTERLAHHALREGEATTWHVGIQLDGAADDTGTAAETTRARAEDVAVQLAAPPWTMVEPESGALCARLDGGAARLAIDLRSTRWGKRVVGPARMTATSAWAAYRFTSVGGTPRTLTTLPLPAVFDSAAPPVHAAGLVGLVRSGRPGDGSEFASIRSFQVGDRLRRIHWPRSLRTGELHVSSTWSDEDSHVVIVVDALNDLGRSEGIDGAASSLDLTVRAAGAIAEHHLQRGDRVALHVVGARGVMRVPVATGSAHLRRMLDALAMIEPATDLHDRALRQLSIPANALVVMLSPLISPIALERAYTLVRRGLTVVVVDTLPTGIVEDDPGDPFLGLAWRIRLLERERELRHIGQLGVPVVQWRGPGSLDLVLRDLRRSSSNPRLVRR